MFRFLSTLLTILIVYFNTTVYAENRLSNAITQPIPISQLVEYSTDSLQVKKLISDALHLSQMNLTYLYGSSDPSNKGMDCSGTIHYLLSLQKIAFVPRQSDELFNWVEKKGKLYRVTINDFNSAEFSKMLPGDLLFWSGTYTTHRSSSISHVMLYLGKNQKGERLMFGSSDGRTYQGKRMRGVSVFDFKLPNNSGPQRFIGYGCIPDLTCK